MLDFKVVISKLVDAVNQMHFSKRVPQTKQISVKGAPISTDKYKFNTHNPL